MCEPTQVRPPGQRDEEDGQLQHYRRSQHGIDGDHIGENGLGLAVDVSEDALGIEDGGEEVLDVNA